MTPSTSTSSDTNLYNFSRMTTSERRREVRRIIIQLSECSKRPLFEEFSIGTSSSGSSSSDCNAATSSAGRYCHDNNNNRAASAVVISTTDNNNNSNSHHTNVNDIVDGNDRKQQTTTSSSTAATTTIAKRRRRDDGVMVTSRKRRWDEIISRASSLLPFMTNDEHGIASRYVTTLLLGYLIPNGTGGPFDVSSSSSCPRSPAQQRRQQQQQQQQQQSRRGHVGRQSSKPSHHSLHHHMPMTVPLQQQQQQPLRPPFSSLAEYLETTTPSHSCQRYNNGLVDETYRLNFYQFVTFPLSLFLSHRAAYVGSGTRKRWDGGGGDDNHHGNEYEDDDDDDVDLLRVLSAVICPSASSLSLHGYYFFANENDAGMMTHIVANYLTLPIMNDMAAATTTTTSVTMSTTTTDDDDDDDDDDMTMDHDGIRQRRHRRRRKGNALFNVAVPLLRRSLQGFLKGAAARVGGGGRSPNRGGGYYQYLAARTALMRIAVQTRCKEWVNEALDDLLMDLVGDDDGDDDGIKCVVKCDCCDDDILLLTETETTTAMTGHCCVVRDIGGLLEELICKYCISSYHADDSFVDRTSQRLARVIENCLSSSSSRKKTNDDVTICQLSSLLNAAKSLFYFFSSESTDNNNKSDKTTTIIIHPRESLIRSAVQLLCHHHPLIVRRSSLLLELALAYNGVYYGGGVVGGGPAGDGDDDEAASANYAPIIFAKVKHAYYNTNRRTTTMTTTTVTASENDSTTMMTTCHLIHALHPLVACLSRQSPRFADAILRVALKLHSSGTGNEKNGSGNFTAAAIFRLACSCSLSQPDIVYRHIDSLEDVFCDFLRGLPLATATKGNDDDDNLSSSIVSHFIVIHLSFNLAMRRQLPNNNTTTIKHDDDDTSRIYQLINQYISPHNHPWILFKLARVSLLTSRFDISQFIYERKLLPLCSSPRYTVWLTILSLVSRAEGRLCTSGAEGLVDAMSLLHSARCYLRSSVMDSVDSGCCFLFQIHILSLRIDFLSLCATARSLAAEMVLLPHDDDHHNHHRNSHHYHPSSSTTTTRSQLFKCRLPDSFDALSRRYWNLYRKHGLARCQKTKGSLRALSRLARCFSRLTEVLFHPLPETTTGGSGNSSSKGGGSTVATATAASGGGGGGKHGNSSSKNKSSSLLRRKRKFLSPLWPRGDVRHHPLMSFVERLEETVLKSLMGDHDEDEDDNVGGGGGSSSTTSHNKNVVVVEPETRACLLREVLEAALKRNGFFPVGFLVVEGLPPATMILSADPMDVSVATTTSEQQQRPPPAATNNNVTGEGAAATMAATTANSGDAMGERNDKDDDDDIAEVLEAVPGLSCRIYASGKIPSYYFKRAKPCLSQVIAWCYVTYDGPLDGSNSSGDRRDEETMAAQPTTTATPEPSSFDDPNATTTTTREGISLIPSRTVMEPTASGPILPNGRFYLPIECIPMETEGYYKVVIELGCRDVRGSEWVIPTGENDDVVFIRVSSDQQSRRGGGGGGDGGGRMKERRGSGSVASGKDEESCAMVLE